MAFLNALPGAVAEGLIWGLMAIGIYISYKILDIADLTVDGSICTGGCVCAVLLAAGAPGKRLILPNARVMIHQPSGGAQGQQTEIEIAAQEIRFCRERLNAILAKHTGKSIEQVNRDTERDNFRSAEAALEYGLVDAVVSKRGA